MSGSTDPSTTTEFLLGAISTKIDALSAKFEAGERRTDARLSKVESDIAGLRSSVDELQAVEDQRRGALRVPVAVWAILGPTATGVVVFVLTRLIGG